MTQPLTNVPTGASKGWRLPPIGKATVKSLASVSVWQLGNYLLPLLFIPYLARVLGVQSFGLTALATAIIAYPLLITDWGFVLLGTQRVSVARDDKAKVNEIIWSVLAAKTVLALISCAVLSIGIVVFVSDPMTRGVLFAAMLNVVAAILSLEWVLRGMERFARFAAASLLGRLMAVPAIFIFVRSPADAANAVLALAVGALCVALLSILMCVRMGVLKSPPGSLGRIASDALDGVKGGSWIFLSSVASSIYVHGLLITLGLMRGAYSVGLYSSVDKIRTPVSNMLSPLQMVFFPRMSALVAHDPERAQRQALRLIAVQGAASLALSIALSATAPIVVGIILGPDFAPSVPILRWIAFLIFITGLSAALGQMVMIPFGLRKEFGYSYFIAAAIAVVLLPTLCMYYGVMGAVAAVLVIEIVVTASMFFFCALRLPWFRPFNRHPSHA